MISKWTILAENIGVLLARFIVMAFAMSVVIFLVLGTRAETAPGVPDNDYLWFPFGASRSACWQVTSVIVPQVGQRIGTLQEANLASNSASAQALLPGAGVYEIPGENPDKVLAADYLGSHIKLIYSGDSAP